MNENPYQSPSSPNPFADKSTPPSSGIDPRVLQAAVEQALRDKHDATVALQILVTSVIGCFAPIIFLYGLIFLLTRSYPFPRKWMAIAGTVLHFIWTIIYAVAIFLG